MFFFSFLTFLWRGFLPFLRLEQVPAPHVPAKLVILAKSATELRAITARLNTRLHPTNVKLLFVISKYLSNYFQTKDTKGGLLAFVCRPPLAKYYPSVAH